MTYKAVDLDGIVGSVDDEIECEGHLLVEVHEDVIEAVTIRCPELGALHLNNHPKPTAIRVGMRLSELLSLLEICLDDDSIEVFGCNSTGVMFCIEALLGVDFTIDCRPQSQWGTATLAWKHDELPEDIPKTVNRLADLPERYVHHPIAEIRTYRTKISLVWGIRYRYS